MVIVKILWKKLLTHRTNLWCPSMLNFRFWWPKIIKKLILISLVVYICWLKLKLIVKKNPHPWRHIWYVLWVQLIVFNKCKIGQLFLDSWQWQNRPCSVIFLHALVCMQSMCYVLLYTKYSYSRSSWHKECIPWSIQLF